MAEEKNQKNLLKKKIELKAVCEWVGEGSRVLDLGCGRGILLYELVRRRNIYAVGVDSDFEKISLCMKKGVSAYHGDIMDMLSPTTLSTGSSALGRFPSLRMPVKSC